MPRVRACFARRATRFQTVAILSTLTALNAWLNAWLNARTLLVGLTYSVVVFSVVVQGLTIAAVVRRLARA